ncbi:MAG: peptidylprolyl isomerase [Phycisphaerae bacterium]
MKSASIVLSAIVALSLPAYLAAQDAPKPSTAPTTASKPAGTPVVMATVGEAKIMSDRVDKIFTMINPNKDIPADKVQTVRDAILGKMIMQELARVYVTAKKIEVGDADMKEQKDAIAKQAAQLGVTVEKFMDDNAITPGMLHDEACLKKMVRETTTKEKVDAYIKAHPDYFDGTKVKASHILVKVEPSDSTEVQKKALAKIKDIAAKLKSGEIKFEDAARQFSDCPSKDKGGDLGEFTFERMVPQFSIKAFATGVGDTSDIVRTQFGFHIIKVTDRKAGKDAPGDEAAAAAKNAMISDAETAIFELGMTTCPIVINK